MKTLILNCTLLGLGALLASTAHGQTTSVISENAERSWVGINTESPRAALHVRGNSNLGEPWSQIYLEPTGPNMSGALVMKSTFDGEVAEWYMGPGSGDPRHNHFRFFIYDNPEDPSQTPGGNILLLQQNGDVGIGLGPDVARANFGIDGNSLRGAVLRVMGAQNKVAIGSYKMTLPGDYGLYVNDGILTSKLKVAEVNKDDWADYVFAPDYELRPLEEVERFIEENQHLPGVPSAEDVARDGVDMVAMDSTLLEKIEELTLYMIEIKKENAELRRQLEALLETVGPESRRP
ncbi:MAG: hypothetical protein AAGM22_32445 [Acidobacteriota bacterium]